MLLQIKEIIPEVAHWIKDEVENSGGKGVVFGLSGGLDSAVVAALCRKAFPRESCMGIIMPCNSSAQDCRDAEELAGALDISWLKISLDKAFASLNEELSQVKAERDTGLAEANLKPRLRMAVLYYIAAVKGFRVVGTSNKSETMVGYFTKHGDGAADLFPLAEFLKREVREMAACLNVPRDIIQKAPSGGLWEGQTDEGELGFTYDQLDDYLENGTASPGLKERIEQLIENSEHKRELPLKFARFRRKG